MAATVLLIFSLIVQCSDLLTPAKEKQKSEGHHLFVVTIWVFPKIGVPQNGWFKHFSAWLKHFDFFGLLLFHLHFMWRRDGSYFRYDLFGIETQTPPPPVYWPRLALHAAPHVVPQAAGVGAAARPAANRLSTVHPEMPTTWDAMTSLWTDSNARWATKVRRAVRHAVHQEHAMSEVRSWHYDVVQALQPVVTFNFDPKDIGLAVVQADTHQCECGQKFTSLRGLQVHRYKRHGQHAPEYFLTDSTICPHCLRQFWTMGRVRQHLAYMPRDGTANPCYAALSGRGVHVERSADVEPPRIPSSARGINRLDATRASGPVRPPPAHNERALQDAALKLQLLEKKAQRRHLHRPEAELRGHSEWDQLSEMTKGWCEAAYDSPGNRSTADEVLGIQVVWNEVFQSVRDQEAHPWEAIFYRWGRSDLAELMATYSDGWTEMALEQAFSETVDAMEIAELDAKWDQAHNKVYIAACRGGEHF